MDAAVDSAIGTKETRRGEEPSLVGGAACSGCAAASSNCDRVRFPVDAAAADGDGGVSTASSTCDAACLSVDIVASMGKDERLQSNTAWGARATCTLRL